MSLDEYVEQVLAQAPPLTDEQKRHLVDLLRPANSMEAAA